MDEWHLEMEEIKRSVGELKAHNGDLIISIVLTSLPGPARTAEAR